MNKIKIAVTGTGSLIGQAIIKSIRRSSLGSELDITGFDYFEKTVGEFWCDRNYLLPDILKPGVTEEQWLTFICERLAGQKIRILFVGVDFELPLFARHKDVIESRTGAIVMVSSQDVITIANDKYLTYQFLKRNGLSCPDSLLPSEDLSSIRYPVIVKPRKGARSKGVSKVRDEAALRLAIDSVDEPVIQEYVGTMESEFTCGTIYLDGSLKKLIVLNRSLKEGNTYISHHRSDYPSIIYEYLEKVSGYLKPNGACNFQLRLTEDGVPKIFEINSRHSGTTYIRSLFGYMEVEYIIRYLTQGVEMNFDLRTGTVVRYYEEFFVNES